MGQSSVRENKEVVPTRDHMQPPQPPKKQEVSRSSSVRDIPTEELNTSERVKKLEEENKKMREKLKNKDKLAK